MRKYEDLGFFELRAIASELGVKNPTKRKKANLIEAIDDVSTGKVEPFKSTERRGRPPKNINVKIIREENQIDNYLNYENLEEIIKGYKLLFEELKLFNAHVNIIIDNFLEKLEIFNS